MLETGIRGKQSVAVTPENTAKTMGSGTLNVFATPSTGGTGRKDLLDERRRRSGRGLRLCGHQAGAGAHRTHPCGHDRDLPQ